MKAMSCFSSNLLNWFVRLGSKKTLSILGIVTLSLVSSGTAAGQNLLTNADFETGTIAPWTSSGSGTATGGVTDSNPYEGIYAAWINTRFNELKYEVDGLTSGNVYTLRGYILLSGGQIEYGVEGIVSSTLASGSGYTFVEIDFAATSETATLYFKEVGGSWAWQKIDNVELVEKDVSCELSVADEVVVVGFEAGTTLVDVETTASFSATSSEPWVSVEVVGEQLELSVDENFIFASREASVLILGCESQTIVVHQEAKSLGCLSFKEPHLIFSNATASKQIEITTEDAFTVSADVPWVSATVDGDIVTVTVSNNWSKEDREGIVTFEGCSVQSLPIVQGGAPHEGEYRNYIGMNMANSNDYMPVWLFADAMKQAREFQSPDFTGYAKVDPDGWPTEDFGVTVISNESIHGTYALSFEGSAESVVISGATVEDLSYDAEENKTSARVIVSEEGDLLMQMVVTGTDGGARDIQMMRPSKIGSNRPHRHWELFARETIRLMRPFDFIRTMSASGTWSDRYNTRVNWEDRNTVYNASQNRKFYKIDENGDYVMQHPTRGQRYHEWEGRGIAWEYLVMFANELNTDLWICVPHAANDDYVTKLAQLVAYGSDGIEPYTSKQRKPLFPPLRKRLKLYVEYSNEVWNTGKSPYHWIDEQVEAELAAGNNSLNYYDGTTNPTYLRQRFASRRTVEISELFRSVFGDDQMHTRVRPLMEWQKGAPYSDGNANRTATQGLLYVDTVYPEPVNHYIWGAGGTTYYEAADPEDGADIETLWDMHEFNAVDWAYPTQANISSLTAAFGLKQMAYEGGPSFGNINGSGGANPLGDEAVADIRMADEIVEHQMLFDEVGGYGFGYFDMASDSRWGFVNRPGEFDTPKMIGVETLIGQNKAKVVHGTPVDSETVTTIIGDRWFLTNAGYGNWQAVNGHPSDYGYDIDPGIWLSYDFNVQEKGAYQFRILYSTSGLGLVRLFLGSELIGSFDVADTGRDDVYSPWIDGLVSDETVNSLRVEALGTEVRIEALEIQQGPVSVPGDLNEDGVADAVDLELIRSAFGASLGDEGYLPELDLDDNGKIDRRDYFLWFRYTLSLDRPHRKSKRHCG